MTKLRHYDQLGTARFITFSCFRNLRLLTDRADLTIFLEELQAARRNHDISLYGFVIMPSHVHLVLHPQKKIRLGRVIGEIKSLSGRRILQYWRKINDLRFPSLLTTRRGEKRYVFWQAKCYDHNCRTRNSVLEKINYCHTNPVRAGLVINPQEWEWSSYNCYYGTSRSLLEMDSLEGKIPPQAAGHPSI